MVFETWTECKNLLKRVENLVKVCRSVQKQFHYFPMAGRPLIRLPRLSVHWSRMVNISPLLSWLTRVSSFPNLKVSWAIERWRLLVSTLQQFNPTRIKDWSIVLFPRSHVKSFWQGTWDMTRQTGFIICFGRVKVRFQTRDLVWSCYMATSGRQRWKASAARIDPFDQLLLLFNWSPPPFCLRDEVVISAVFSRPCQSWYCFTNSWNLRILTMFWLYSFVFAARRCISQLLCLGRGFLLQYASSPLSRSWPTGGTSSSLSRQSSLKTLTTENISNISLNMVITSALTVTWNTSPWLPPSWCQQGLGGHEQLHQRVPATVPTVQRGRLHLLAGE